MKKSLFNKDVEADGYYDEETDTFITKDTYSVDTDNPFGITEEARGYDVETENGNLHLYPFGANNWIWDDMSDYPSVVIQTADGNLWHYLGYEDGFHKVTVVDKDNNCLTDTAITSYLTDEQLVGAVIY